jgi:uncharacterized membrane protein YfbV (UPF0208 family)
MLNSVRAWPQYQKLHQIVQEYGVDIDRITKYLREQSAEQLQNMLNSVQARPEYQKLLETLRQMADHAIEYFREQFCFNCPYNTTSEHGK